MVVVAGTLLLIVLGLASVFVLRLGWLGADAFHERARKLIVVEHVDETVLKTSTEVIRSAP